MLKTLALAAVAAFAVAGAASAQNMGATHAFLSKAGASDMFEIAEAKLVADKSHNPKLRRFAARMIHDHTASSAKLKAAGEAGMGHMLMAPEMSPEQAKMLADLQAAHGHDFDKTYVTQQVGAHEEALALMKDYAKTRDYPKIAKVAADIVPAVQMHLAMARSLKREIR